MATPSTVAVGRPEVGVAAERLSHAGRFRRVFRRRARERRSRHPECGAERATLRVTTRV